MYKLRILGMAALLAVALGAASSEPRAATMRGLNIVDLLKHSQGIVTGTVQSVTDGIDSRGIPYTEVTLEIHQTLRGHDATTYTFRQFGLLAAREMGNGRTLLPAPAGFPAFAVGQDLLLFLNEPASATGLQTTLGLGYGKFVLGAGSAENDFANEGLFADVSIEATLATDLDKRMMATTRGSVDTSTLLSLVQRAVEDNWVESGLLWRTSEGRPTAKGGAGGGRKFVVDQQP